MITFLEFADEKTLAMKVSGKLTHQDYEEFIIPKLELILATHDSAHVYIQAEDFHGWDFRAAWDDFSMGIKHRHEIDRVAIVGDQEWEQWLSKTVALMMKGEVRFFHPAQQQTAQDWILGKEA